MGLRELLQLIADLPPGLALEGPDWIEAGQPRPQSVACEDRDPVDDGARRQLVSVWTPQGHHRLHRHVRVAQGPRTERAWPAARQAAAASLTSCPGEGCVWCH